MDNINPKIKERFLELPKKIQDIITESGWQYEIREIVKKNNLRLDQGSALELETLLVMLGFEKPSDYISNIKKEATLSEEQAQKITEGVSKNIFQKILSALAGEDKEEEAKEGKFLSSTKSIVQEHILDRDKVLDEMKEHVEILDGNETTKTSNSLPEIRPNISPAETNDSLINQNLSSINQTKKEDVFIETKSAETKTTETKLGAEIDPYREVL